MDIVELKNLQREEGHIFYIKKYTACISIQLPTKLEDINIKFSIEMNPLGGRTVNLQILSQVNYPLIPLRKSIIEYLINQDIEGNLPC